jgi:hypothetical protein
MIQKCANMIVIEQRFSLNGGFYGAEVPGHRHLILTAGKVLLLRGMAARKAPAAGCFLTGIKPAVRNNLNLRSAEPGGCKFLLIRFSENCWSSNDLPEKNHLGADNRIPFYDDAHRRPLFAQLIKEFTPAKQDAGSG